MLCASVFIQELDLTVFDLHKGPFTTATNHTRKTVIDRLYC